MPKAPSPSLFWKSFYNSDKPIALVCHSPGVLRHVTVQERAAGKRKARNPGVNEEEEDVHLTKVVPFLVEDETEAIGGDL